MATERTETTMATVKSDSDRWIVRSYDPNLHSFLNAISGLKSSGGRGQHSTSVPCDRLQ